MMGVDCDRTGACLSLTVYAKQYHEKESLMANIMEIAIRKLKEGHQRQTIILYANCL